MKLKDIKGCLVEKKVKDDRDGDLRRGCRLCRNEAIDQQGEVEIALNREKLAIEIWTNDSGLPSYRWDVMHEETKKKYLRIADAIISKLDQIVEVRHDQ